MVFCLLAVVDKIKFIYSQILLFDFDFFKISVHFLCLKECELYH